MSTTYAGSAGLYTLIDSKISTVENIDQFVMLKQIFLSLGIEFTSSTAIDTDDPYNKIVVKSETNKLTIKFKDNIMQNFFEEELEEVGYDGYGESAPEYFGQETSEIDKYY